MTYLIALYLLAWFGPAEARSGHYRLDATFDLDRGAIQGAFVYEPSGSAPPLLEFLIRRDHIVHSIRGADLVGRLPHPTSEQMHILTLRTHVVRGIPRAIRVRFSGPSAASWTLIESGREDFWFPITQGAMGPFTAEATIAGIPGNMHLVSNGIVSRHGDSVRIRLTEPDYDLVLVGAPGLSGRMAGDVEFVAGDHALPDNRVFADHAAAALTFVEDWFRPLSRPIRVVSLDHQRQGGYYHRGIVVVRQTRTPPVPEMYASEAAYLMSHEFAHHFWPEFVLSTGDKWLAESVVSYVGLRFVEQRFGLPSREAMLDLYRRYMPPDAGPIAVRGGDREATNAALYFKGPLALFDLEARIGRDRLDSLSRAIGLSEEPRSTAAFLRHLAAMTDEGVAAEFAARLHAAE